MKLLQAPLHTHRARLPKKTVPQTAACLSAAASRSTSLKLPTVDPYRHPTVFQRLAEYLGGDSLEHATAVYLTQSDGCRYQARNLHPTTELQWFLDRELDVARSLADTEVLLLHLDIEYVNFDASGAAFADPLRAFELQEPVVAAIQEVLGGFGIQPLHLLTGQGHHFVWSIPRHGALERKLIELAPAPELLGAELCI